MTDRRFTREQWDMIDGAGLFPSEETERTREEFSRELGELMQQPVPDYGREPLFPEVHTPTDEEIDIHRRRDGTFITPFYGDFALTNEERLVLNGVEAVWLNENSTLVIPESLADDIAFLGLQHAAGAYEPSQPLPTFDEAVAAYDAQNAAENGRYVAGLPSQAEDGERKAYPLATGLLDYFPDALAEVAHASLVATAQHGHEGMHWDRNKSRNEEDTLLRHFVERGTFDKDGVRHSAKVAWRALALLQKEIEKDAGVDISPASRASTRD